MAVLPPVVCLAVVPFVKWNVDDPKLSMRVGDIGVLLGFALAGGLGVWIGMRQAHVLQRGGWRLCPSCGETFSGDGQTQCGGCGRNFEGRVVRQRWRKWLMRGYACSLAEPFGVLVFGIISSLRVVELFFGKEANGAEPGVEKIVAMLGLLSLTVIAAAWMFKIALERRRRVRAARFCVCEQCGYPYEGEGEITCTECGDVFNGAEVRMRWLERVT